MKPEREFTIPEVGLLQWWSNAPWPDVHWYAGEDRRVYRVTLDQDGAPVSVADERGTPVNPLVSMSPAQDTLI